jgi:hypothetical protein
VAGRLSPRTRLGLLAAIVGLGFLLRAWGLTWGLTNANVSTRTHPDEWTVYWLFRWFDGSGSLNPCPNSHTSCFFDWGMVFPYLAYGLHWLLTPLFWALPGHPFGSHVDQYYVHAVLAGRIVSVVLSTATIVVTYRLATMAFGPATGLLSALLVALSGLLIQLAHFATPDSTMLFFMSLGLLAVYVAYRSPGSQSFRLAGAVIGAAAGTEFHMALLVLPLFVAWRLANPRQTAWIVEALGFAAGLFVILNPYALIDFPSFLSALDHAVRIRTVDSQIQYQNRWDRYGPAWLFVVQYSLGYGVGYALTVWMLLGAGVALLRRRAADWILLSWVLPYFVLVTISPARFMRYSAPLLVPLAILAARAAVEASHRAFASRRAGSRSSVPPPDGGRLRPTARRLVTAVDAPGVSRTLLPAAIAFALLYSFTYDAAYAGLFASPDPRLAAESWAAQHVARRSEMAFEQVPDGLVNLPIFMAAAGVRECFADPARISLIGTPYIALDDFTLDEVAPGNGDDLPKFRAAVEDGSRYRLAYNAHDTPTFLGMTFPIDGSPHDWRYPSHHVAVYELRSLPTTDPPACIRSVAATNAPLR